MVCPHCGKENENNATRCMVCGSAFQTHVPPERKSGVQLASLFSLPSWMYALFGVILVVSFLILLGHHSESPSAQVPEGQNKASSLDRSQATTNGNGSNETSSEPDTGMWVTSAVMSVNGDLFAGTNYGLYSSTNRGDTWQFVPIKNEFGTVSKDLAYVNDAGANRIIASYICTDTTHGWNDVGDTYYYLYDAAAKMWHALYPPIGITGHRRLSPCFVKDFIASRGLNEMYAVVADYWEKSGVYCSTNNGKTWSSVGLKTQHILKLWINNQGTLFATVTSKGVSYPNDRNLYRSANGGAS